MEHALVRAVHHAALLRDRDRLPEVIGRAGDETFGKRAELAEGFIAGAADHFGQSVSISQRSCMMDGADECVLVCDIGGKT